MSVQMRAKGRTAYLNAKLRSQNVPGLSNVNWGSFPNQGSDASQEESGITV